MGFDAITVAPYMGADSVKPFLQYDEKWVIMLGLTSNEGAADFQLQTLIKGKKLLFEHVLDSAKEWGSPENMMFVVGATQTQWMKKVRKIVPDHFLLVPGVGAQGGDLLELSDIAMNKKCGLLVNASRSIIYADGTNRFDEIARTQAERLKHEMTAILSRKKII
jgi:orotidine-5'-phosphate decarboxylase